MSSSLKNIPTPPVIERETIGGWGEGGLVMVTFEECSPNFVLCALHAEKFENFWCLDCHLATPIAFFKGSLPPEAFKRAP